MPARVTLFTALRAAPGIKRSPTPRLLNCLRQSGKAEVRNAFRQLNMVRREQAEEGIHFVVKSARAPVFLGDSWWDGPRSGLAAESVKGHPAKIINPFM